MKLERITPPAREPVGIYETLVQGRITLDDEIKDVKHNLHASANPAAGDDSGDGYAPGSLWRNAVTDAWYKAATVAPGAAVWNPYEISAYDKQQITDIDEAIIAARRHAEHFMGRAIITQEWELVLDGFPPGEIRLPLPALQEIVSVTYIDTAGVEQEMPETDYEARPDEYSGKIRPVSGRNWPATKDAYDTVRIRFKAGYGDSPSDVEADIRRAVKMYAAEMYERREHALVAPVTTIETREALISANNLMWPYRAL